MFNSGKTHSAPQFNAFVTVSSTIESRASAKNHRGISVESTATGSAIDLLCKPSANKELCAFIKGGICTLLCHIREPTQLDESALSLNLAGCLDGSFTSPA